MRAVEVGKQCVSKASYVFVLFVYAAILNQLKLKLIPRVCFPSPCRFTSGTRRESHLTKYLTTLWTLCLSSPSYKDEVFWFGERREKKKKIDPLTASYPRDRKRATLS